MGLNSVCAIRRKKEEPPPHYNFLARSNAEFHHVRLSPKLPWPQSLEIGFMLPNRSAGASRFWKLGYLEPYLFLSASRPSAPLYSPILGRHQKHEYSVLNLDTRQASKTPLSTPLSPYWARFRQILVHLKSVSAISKNYYYPPRIITFCPDTIVISASAALPHAPTTQKP